MLPGMPRRARATDDAAPGCRSSLLHVCGEVATELRERGLDPSLVHADQLISLLAARQDDVVTWHQLTALGLGRGVIARRVERGMLQALHVGVYLWATAVPTFRGRARGAVLCGGDGAWASHHAAAALWAIRPEPAGPVDVTVIGRRLRARGVRGHEVRAPSARDLRTIGGIPVSAPARALLEVAPELTSRELADAVERAQIKRLVSGRDVAGAIERAPRRPGVAALRALLEEPGFTRSVAERRLRALLRAAALPLPAFNAVAEGYEVDVLWRRERVVLEFDSYTFHATRSALQRDRRRTAALQRARYVVLRTTWIELTKQSHALIARTAEALALSAYGPRASPARGAP
jgi:very-short-patch-repair endonuclease